MKKIKIITILSIITLISLSCKTQKLVVDKNAEYTKANIDYTIQDFSIDKNIIDIKIKYKGCSNDKFSLLFNKSYLKSFPPQAILFLKHDKSTKNCDKEITKELKFDITEVAYPRSKKVYIKLMSSDKKVPYEY